jgi:hypothetical protein
MPTQKIDPARSLSTQPYRTTKAAQTVARQLEVYRPDGSIATLRPLVDTLSPRTLATLTALKGGRQ